jgi:type VI secretion system VasD/TssJ family lipoprotein
MNRTAFAALAALALALCAAGCGTTKGAVATPQGGAGVTAPQPPTQAELNALAAPPPDWRYEKGAISLRLKADPKLNLFKGDPHTLLVCVYSLRDPNGFNQQADERDGVSTLLECGKFDGSVAAVKRFLVQPGQEVAESLDRAEGAKYVGVVAGYYNIKKENVLRLYPVPVVVETVGSIMNRSKVSRPAPLAVELGLGPEGLK